MSNFYFLEIQEEKKGNITTSLLTFGNQLRIIVFNFIVPLVLIVFLKYMIIQDEFELAHVSFYVILWKFFHIFVLIILLFMQKLKSHKIYSFLISFAVCNPNQISMREKYNVILLVVFGDSSNRESGSLDLAE